MSLLELQAVSAGYGATPVVRGVSLTVAPGEAWAVLGPNGTGKSTLIRAVMGLLPARTGAVRVCGQALTSLSARALAQLVAWVPQTMDDDTGFTGLELVLMGRAPHLAAWSVPGTSDEAQALAAMQRLGVEHLAARPLSEVSGGERRRVWLARALMQAPKVLVLDEPTAFLDVRHQVETLRVVKDRVESGLGVLAVLHDVNLARQFATHALLLKHGVSVAQGPVAEVLTPERLTALFDIDMQRRETFAPRFPGAP